MSQPSGTVQSPVDRHEWDPVLVRPRADGLTPVESIKVTRAVLHVDLGEAKRIVHESPAWSDARDDFEHLHDAAESVASSL